MKKGINGFKQIMAVSLSIMILVTNGMTVLAADWVTNILLNGVSTVNFQPAENDTVTNAYEKGMLVFVDGVQQGGTIAENGSYTIPAGVTGATLTNPAPQETNKPLELKLTTVNAPQTPSVNPGQVYHHQCTYEWEVTLEPTLEDDGICSYMCKECKA